MKRELEEKLGRVRLMMAAGGLSAVHVAGLGNLAWLLCGADALVSFADAPVAEAVVTQKGLFVLVAEVERDRLEAEELPDDVAVHYYPWQDPNAKEALLKDLLGTGEVLSDTPGRGFRVKDFWPLRVPLTPEEVARYRALGRDAGETFTEVAQGLEPGLTEHEVAGRLALALRSRGMQPALILVAADERLRRYRHPLPKENPFRERLMMVACARRGGLYANLTRLVSAGPLPPGDQDAYARLLEVERALLDGTRHGVLASDFFREMTRAYAEVGWAGEWLHHHQGGPCGYGTRDFLLLQEGSGRMLVDGSAYAWNPSLPGLKVEDTVLLLNDELAVLTADPNWPSVEVGGRARPEVLVLAETT